MSQFPPSPEPTAFEGGGSEMQGPKKTSGMAVASIISSCIFFCPLTTLLGPLLGLIALGQISKNDRLKGRGLAIAGILIGVILTVLWAVGTWFMIEKGKEMFAVIMKGPEAALVAGTGGDVAGFKDEFHGRGATASDEEAQDFLDELESRYGAFLSSAFDESTQPPQPAPGQPEATFPYRLTFQNGTVDAEALIIFADQTSGNFVMKIGELTVFDGDLGDLTYPPAP